MDKIVIIGSSGAGKSTLARELGSILKIKVFHLDRFFWQRGWKVKARDTRIDILQEIVREKQWIIEGTYLSSSELHLNAADTIIFLDIPPLVCLWRLTKRHREYYGCSRRDIPEGCTDRLTRLLTLRVLTFPLQDRRTIKQKLRRYKSKQIIWLRSRKEVEDFLAQQKQGTDDQRNFSSLVPFGSLLTRVKLYCRKRWFAPAQANGVGVAIEEVGFGSSSSQMTGCKSM